MPLRPSALPLAFWSLDAAGRFTAAAGPALARLGLEPRDLLGTTIWTVYAGRPDLLAIVRAALAGIPWEGVAEFGGLRWSLHYQPTTGGGLIAWGHIVEPEAEPAAAPVLVYRALQPIPSLGIERGHLVTVTGAGRLVVTHPQGSASALLAAHREALAPVPLPAPPQLQARPTPRLSAMLPRPSTRPPN
jgi:hypothetical protein